MISILIPAYNRDVVKLVLALASQCELLHQPSEIIVLDDGSDTAFTTLNKKLAAVPGVQYRECVLNMGRIGARQQLANTATYEWLLFLDCDSVIVSEHFLKIYYDKLTNYNGVIVGGRMYDSGKPADCNLRLHWKYGSQREITRCNHKRHTNRFMTNNFMIRKSDFQQFIFTEGWSGYGYEDTWMAIQLEEMKISLKFINNPVLHDGVETCSNFLSKSEEALRNLKRLSELVSPGILAKYVKLYSYYHKLKSWNLLWLLKLIYWAAQKSINKNLHSCNPSLIVFDLYRLYYFVKLGLIKTTRA